MKTTIEVEISNIEVDEYNYSFEYKIRVNGKLKLASEYDSDHAWQNDLDKFESYLKIEGAVKTALEQWI